MLLKHWFLKNLVTRKRSNKRFLPIKVCQPWRVPETFCEGIGVYLQFSDQLVLVGGDRCEHGLREDEGPMLLPRQIRDRTASLPHLDEVDPWLVPMHWVQYDLPRKIIQQVSVGFIFQVFPKEKKFFFFQFLVNRFTAILRDVTWWRVLRFFLYLVYLVKRG